MTTTDLLMGEKRLRNRKDFMAEETNSAEKVMERGNDQKAKMHQKGEEETVGDKMKSLQEEEIFNTKKEPEISGGISVTDGSKTQGFETKEKVMTGHETKTNKVAAVQDERTEQKELYVQQTVEEIQDKKADDVETTSKKKEMLIKSLEEGAPKTRIVESQEAEEKSNTTEKEISAKQKTLAKKQVRQQINAQSVQLTDSQSKENETVDKLENESHKAENKIEGIQLAVSKGNAKKEIPKHKSDSMKEKALQIPQRHQHKDITDKQLLQEDAPAKLIRTDVYNKIRKSSKQEDQVEMREEFDNFQWKTVAVEDQDVKQAEQRRNEGNASDIMSPADQLLHKTIQSKVVTLKDKLVKVSPMEGATEMKPSRKTVFPQSLSEKITATDSILQKPEIISQSRTPKEDVFQNVGQQAVADQFVADKHIQVSPEENIKAKQEQSERLTTMKPETEKPQQTLVERCTSKTENMDKVECDPPTRPVESKEMEQNGMDETKDLELKVCPKMVSADNKQQQVSPTDDIKTQQKQTERKSALAKTEEILGEGVKSNLLMSKDKMSLNEKGKRAALLEMSQTEGVSRKDKEQKVVKSEDTQAEVQSEFREDETDKVSLAEEHKTKIRNIFRKAEEKEKSEVGPQKKRETQKQGQQRPVTGKAQDGQSQTIRIKEVKEARKQELIEKTQESLIAGDCSDKCARISEAGEEVVENHRLDVISTKIKPLSQDTQEMSTKVTKSTGENKIQEIPKRTRQEQAKTKVAYTAEPVSEELPSEKFTPETLKPSKAGKTTGQPIHTKTITDKCTQITPVGSLDRTDKCLEMQGLSKSDKIIPRVSSFSLSNTEKPTTEENTSIRVTEKTAKIDSKIEATQKCKETKERKSSAADLTATSEKSQREIQMAIPKEAISVQREPETVWPQEKHTKPQEIIVEHNQLMVSTVKDKTFKVIPTEERETTQEQIKTKVAVSPMMEEMCKELKVAPEEGISEVKVTEFAKAEVDTDDTPQKNEGNLMKVRPRQLCKTQETEDQPIPSKLKVTTFKHLTPKAQEQQVKRNVSDKGIHESDKGSLTEELSLYKIDKQFQKQHPQSQRKKEKKQLLRVDSSKGTAPMEAGSGDISEVVHHKKDERSTSVKSKKILTEDALTRTVAVTDECVSIAPCEALQIKQEHIKRLTSVAPVIDEAAETLVTKDKNTKIDILKPTITCDVDPDESKKCKVASIEKKSLKRQEQIDSTGSGASEHDVAYKQSLVEYDYVEKEDKTAKPAPVEEKKRKQEQTNKVKGAKPDEVLQEKDVAETLTKMYKIAAKVIKDETGKCSTSVATKLPEQEPTEQTLHDTLSKKQRKPSEEMQSKTVTEKHGYSSITPFEMPKTKQEQVKGMFSVPPVMEVASEKPLIVKYEELITDTSNDITVEQTKTKDIVKEKPEKTEVRIDISRAAEQNLTCLKNSLTKTEIPIEKYTAKTTEESDDIPLEKKAMETEEEQNLDKISPVIVENVPTKIKSSKKEQSSLGESTKNSPKDMQSKTVSIKNEYGSVSPLEVTETKQEQITNKFSVAPEMEIASERSHVVKDGNVKSDNLKLHFTPDKLLKDTTSRKECVYDIDEVSLTKRDTDVITVEAAKSTVDLAQHETKTVSPIEEELLERWKQTEGKTSVSSDAAEEASEKSSVTNKVTTLLSPEEIKNRQKQTKEKTGVIPATGVEATKSNDIQPKKSKFPNKNGQMLEKRTFPVEEVESMIVTVKDEHGSVSLLEVREAQQGQVIRTISVPTVMTIASEKPVVIKEGYFKMDKLQRGIIPDKDVKDITSKKQGVHESSEVPFIGHPQSPPSAQRSLEILAEKHEITNKDTKAKEVPDYLKPDQKKKVDTKQKQTQPKAEWTTVTHQKTQEVHHSPGYEEVRYDGTSQKKSYSLKDQHQVTVEGNQSKTETIRDDFPCITPTAETNQEQLEQIKIGKLSLDERYRCDVTGEEVQSTIIAVKDGTGTVSPIKEAKMKLEHIESKATETPKQSLKSDDRPETYIKRGILIDRIATKEEITTAVSNKRETKDKEQWPTSKPAGDEAITVTPEEEIKSEHEQVIRQSKLPALCQANKNTEIQATGQEQIKGELLVTPRELVPEEGKISDKCKPTEIELKADFEVLPLYEPKVREPSVTDETEQNITEKTTTDYKTDATVYSHGANRRTSEIQQSCLEADFQYIITQELEPITKDVEGPEGIHSTIETTVLSLEPEGKANVSLQQSFRGI